LVSVGGGHPTWVVAFLMGSCAVTAISVIAVRSRSFERGNE
jgi:MHS family shikimate/dehydroshikimate transporter-like MFS transporter